MVKSKSALRKNTLRTIVRSPGRYLAILGIIMLGAGFFAGLRGTRDAIILTADDYLKKAVFFDFQLVSTLGLEEDAADKLEGQAGIVAAEGSKQHDALVSFLEDDQVIRFYSLPKKVNLVTVTEGRLPERDDEILLDASANRSFALGDEVLISALNSEDTLSLFTHGSYIVTGFCTSPLYLNFERGSSALGTGSVAAFAYLLPEGFATDYLTSVYVSGGFLGSIYTDEYDAGADAMEPLLKPLAEGIADERFRAVYDENRQVLEDAEAEYADGLAEYEEKKADALRQIADGEQELAEAAVKLDDGQKEYDEGTEALAAGKEEAEAQFADAQQKLDDALQQLSDGEKAYGEGLAEYEAGEASYSAGLAQYENSVQQYSGVLNLLDQYVAFRNDAEDVRGRITELMTSYSEITLDPLMTPEERQQAIKALWEGSRENLNRSLTALIASSQVLADRLGAYFGETQAVKNFRSSIEALQLAKDTLENGELADSLRSLLASTKALYDGAAGILQQLSDQGPQIRSQLENARKQLAAARVQLNEARAQLAESRKQLDDGWDEYFAGEQTLRDEKAKVQEEFADAEARLAEAAVQLEEGRAEYEQGVLDLEAAKAEAEEEFAKAEAELADARKELDDGWARLSELEEPAAYVLGRWSNIGYACLDSDAQIVSSVAKVFPVFFFAVAALICVTTMARMVDEQRGQLGVLLALGYSRRKVMNKFLFYAGSATFLGCGIGVPLFSFVFPQIIWQAYRIIYSFTPRLLFFLDWPLYGIVTALYLAAMLLVTWSSLHGQLKAMPAAILRPKAPKLGKRVLLEKIPFIWNRLSFMWKVTMRNIFRYRSRVLMMLLGVAGCTALMITGYGIRDSIQDVVGYQYGEITLYEYDVTFQEAPDEELREAFLQTARRFSGDATFVYSQSVTARSEKKEKSAYLLSAESGQEFSRYLHLHQGQTEIPFPGRGQTAVNNGLAGALGVKEGDAIVFKLDDTEYELTVSGVFDNYIYNYLIISDETFEMLTGAAPAKKDALVLKREGAGDATARLLSVEGVTNVTAGSLLKDRIGSIMDNLIYIVLLTIICAAALAFIVIYNLININITERMREIATVKVLGFYAGESAIYILRENILLTGLGALLGVPLGILLNTYVMSAIQVDLVHFEARVKFPSFLWAIGFTLLFSVLVYLIMMHKLSKIDMASALKAAE